MRIETATPRMAHSRLLHLLGLAILAVALFSSGCVRQAGYYGYHTSGGYYGSNFYNYNTHSNNRVTHRYARMPERKRPPLSISHRNERPRGDMHGMTSMRPGYAKRPEMNSGSRPERFGRENSRQSRERSFMRPSGDRRMSGAASRGNQGGSRGRHR